MAGSGVGHERPSDTRGGSVSAALELSGAQARAWPTVEPGCGSYGVTRDLSVSGGLVSLVPECKRLRLEYLEIVDPNELQPVEHIAGPVLVAGALWVGSTRLIDNALCQPNVSCASQS